MNISKEAIALNAEKYDKIKKLPARFLAWATQTFGPIALDKRERALRLIEEALELGQALGVEREVFEPLLERVYSRPAGDVDKEIGQVAGCLMTLALRCDVDPDEAAAKEFDRVCLIPKDVWTARHQAKVDVGVASNSGEN